MNTTKYTIDKIQNIEIELNKYNNELSALVQLRTGMNALYDNTKQLELEILKKSEEVRMKLDFHCAPGYEGILSENQSMLLPCYFHWFGNSLINYARLSGFIVGREKGVITDDDLQYEPERKKIKKYCDEYVTSIPELKEALKWRHKVSAHFALTDPRPDDNIATMQTSIEFPISYVNERFRTGSLITIMSSEDISYESEIPNWSLTETFEKLVDRFWPDVVCYYR